MKKQVTVRIKVQEPTISYEKDTQWSRLEKLAGNCPVPYSSSGYDLVGSVREYDYSVETRSQAEEIRIYWTQSEVEIGITPDVEIWDEEEDAILNPDEIEVRGIE